MNPAIQKAKPSIVAAQTKNYRPEIDGLRAVAVIAVIINHFNKDLLPSGYLGVDIFFVISGYVITSSLAGRNNSSASSFLGEFYARRIKRLAPALITFVVATSALACLFIPDPKTSLKTGFASLFGLSNLFLLHESTDYFATSTELNPFTHTWSLGVEEQFYFVFPLLIWFSGFTKQSEGSSWRLLSWIGLLATGSLLGFIGLYRINQPAAYFLMPTRFWEMAAGCLVYISLTSRSVLGRSLERVQPGWVIAAMVGTMFLPLNLAAQATISIVTLTAALICCLKAGTTAYTALTDKMVVYIGLISYSLYLWHWPVLAISRWSIGIHWWSTPFLILLTVASSIASYELIEKRFRKPTSTSSLKLLTIGAIALSLGAALIKLLSSTHQQLFLSKLYNVHQPPPTSDIKGRPFNPTCVVDGTTRPLHPETFSNCTVPPFHTKAPMIWAFGDSHAGHLGGMLNALRREQGIGYHLVETPGIPFPQTSTRPFQEREKIFEQAKRKMRRGDIILLSRLYIDRRTSKAASDLDDWVRGTQSLSTQMKQLGIKVVIVQPSPIFPTGSPACNSTLLAQLNERHCFQSHSQYQSIFSRVNNKLIALKTRDDNISLLDPTKALCRGSGPRFCAMVIHGAAVYRDNDHLNSRGSAMLSTLLREGWPAVE